MCIRDRPDGYQTVISNEMSSLSAGEKQLLTICRAFLVKPNILILDEATSSVDTRTEAMIDQALDKLREGRTSFVIAHRLSTIRNADVILVMENGHIAVSYTHLIAKKQRMKTMLVVEEALVKLTEHAESQDDQIGISLNKNLNRIYVNMTLRGQEFQLIRCV